MTSNSHTTDDVFGVSRDLPLNYVERAGIDDRFVTRLSQRHNVVIYGSSKQGKTSLRKNCLQESDYIVVSASNTWTLSALHEAILKKAGYRIELSTSKTVSGGFKLSLSADVRSSIPFIGKGKISTDGSTDGSKTRAQETAPLEIDANDANDVIDALNELNFDNYIVIEDFHYLPEETQRNFAFALKTFHETSAISFIIVGVWREDNRLTGFNGDLTERVHSIDVDKWDNADLKRVVDAGEKLLNITFADPFIENLIESSSESVHLVQEGCRRACEMQGISNTQQENVLVGENLKADEIIQAIVRDQSGRYMGFLQNVADGFQETKKEMPKWVIYAILSSRLEELEKDLRYKTISEKIKSRHPDGQSLNPGNITQALQSFTSLQSKKNVRPIIADYDTQNRALYIVDRGFSIWLANSDRHEIMTELDLPFD